MSSIVVTTNPLLMLNQLATNGIRRPDEITGTGTVTFTWTPDLAPADQTTASDLALMANFGVTMTLAEWQSIKADAALLQTFAQGTVASKTLADVVNATRAQSRILRVIVRS